MAAWDKKRNEVIFQDKQVQNDDSGESGNDSEEIEDETRNHQEKTKTS